MIGRVIQKSMTCHFVELEHIIAPKVSNLFRKISISFKGIICEYRCFPKTEKAYSIIVTPLDYFFLNKDNSVFSDGIYQWIQKWDTSDKATCTYLVYIRFPHCCENWSSFICQMSNQWVAVFISNSSKLGLVVLSFWRQW